jgi:hypothetical protein
MRVFIKTEKGQSEIQTRAHKLPPRLRQALILVDGKRDEDQLHSLILGEQNSVLDSLMSEGFIEEVLHTEPMPLESRPFDVEFAPRSPSVEDLRRDVVRALNDALGPEAESMALRIERSKNMADLGPAIGQAVQLMRMTRGDEVAKAFAARFVA